MVSPDTPRARPKYCQFSLPIFPESEIPIFCVDSDSFCDRKEDVKQRWPLDSRDARLASFCRLAALSNFFAVSRTDRDCRAAQCADSCPGRAAGGCRALAVQSLETTPATQEALRVGGRSRGKSAARVGPGAVRSSQELLNPRCSPPSLSASERGCCARMRFSLVYVPRAGPAETTRMVPGGRSRDDFGSLLLPLA